MYIYIHLCIYLYIILWGGENGKQMAVHPVAVSVVGTCFAFISNVLVVLFSLLCSAGTQK